MSQHNNGGGHQTSVIELKNELAKAQKALLDEHKGRRASCSRCGEKFSLSAIKYNDADEFIFSAWLSRGNCPYCKSFQSSPGPIVHSRLSKHVFNVSLSEGHSLEIRCLRIPSNFRPLQIVKI
jgi:hypothetical protein